MSMPSSEPRSRRVNLAILFAVVIVDLVGFGIVIPILPFYAESYGANASVLGFLLTSYAAMQFVFAPLWGRLSDRIGRRPVMLLTIAGTALALLLLGTARSLFWLFVGRILGGLFGANVSVATAYIADVTPSAERTRWMGLVGASFGVGFILGPAIGGALAPLGHGAPMLAAAALAGVNFLVALLALAEPEHRAARETGARAGFLEQSELVRRVCLAFFLSTLATSQLETVFAYYMLDRFHYGARQVAWILVLMAVIMAGVQAGGLRELARRFGERALLLYGSLILAACFALLPWLPTVPLLLLPLAASSIGRGVSQPAMLGFVSTAAAESERGAVMGIFQSSGSLARVMGPLLAGALYDLWYPGPFLLAAALMVSVLALASGLPRDASEAAAPGPVQVSSHP